MYWQENWGTLVLKTTCDIRRARRAPTPSLAASMTVPSTPGSVSHSPRRVTCGGASA
jgi:hypothetical protein